MFKTFNATSSVAYFSMEIGLDASIPTYSGGLGILAGDTLRAAADLSVPMVAVTLLYRKGYFLQKMGPEGQREEPVSWSPDSHLECLPAKCQILLENRLVSLRAWRLTLKGARGYPLPVYFLDTSLPENTDEDQRLTDHLYGGDSRYRLNQEIVLGFGGIAMLRALGHSDIETYHMNEGHSAFLTLALLEESMKSRGEPLSKAGPQERKAIRDRCVFTTHTPVPAGHDQFPIDMVKKALGDEKVAAIGAANCGVDHTLNMTHLALAFSRYVNGVAMRHGQISRGMFPGYPIDSITNGVHAGTWTSPPFRRLFDETIPYWRIDNHFLRHAVDIPVERIRQAHREAKEDLIREIERQTGERFDGNAFTVGFARRATGYKRAGLLFSDPERLKAMARGVGPVQIVYGGKAHPRDESGKEIIRFILGAKAALREFIRVVYLEEYDMRLASLIVAGVDLWLNTPHKPQEASGTSGMKAALNGVPSLSILDGWWIEGHWEGVTGWAIGEHWGRESEARVEINSLYDKLEGVILPLYYKNPDAYAEVMRSSIALNGSFFNSQRMMLQYVHSAYSRARADGP